MTPETAVGARSLGARRKRTLTARERVDSIKLPDQRVAVCGDWHGNHGWVRVLANALSVLAPDVTTILQLGDWSMNPDETDEIFDHTNITRIYVTLGNHEPWGRLTRILDKRPGIAVRVSELTWILPRPARMSIGGRSVLSLGGAASVDRESREEGLTWWPDEAITDLHVEAAIAGGPADLMLTHESPAGSPVRAVREQLRKNPHWFPAAALEASAASRVRVSKVWDAVRPELLTHGHMHIAGGGMTDDGRRVASLGRDTQEGSLGILDMRTLKMTTPSLRQIRDAGDRGEERRVAREKSMHSAAEALHSGVLDGRRPSPDAIRDAWDYIDGRRTLDELIEDVIRRHTRTPEDKP